MSYWLKHQKKMGNAMEFACVAISTSAVRRAAWRSATEGDTPVAVCACCLCGNDRGDRVAARVIIDRDTAGTTFGGYCGAVAKSGSAKAVVFLDGFYREFVGL